MLFKNKKVIGIDIGTSTIKVAEMKVTRNGGQLLNLGVISTPPHSVSSGEITDIGSVGITVQVILNDLKIKCKNAATGMWGTAVIVKKVTIPRMDLKLLKDQIRFEAEQYIPFDMNSVSLAYNVLQNSGTQETMDVLLIAAQNELITQYTQVAATAGLNCSVLDVSGFALANCFELNYGQFPGQAIGIFNFGAAITNFVVVSNLEVIFSRDIPVGGSNYTNEISKSMGITIEEAEALKLSASEKKEVPEEVHNIIKSTNEIIADEIRNSLEFLNATSDGLNLSRCFYTGGSSTVPGLVETLNRVTQLPFESFNPFNKIKYDESKYSPAYIEQIAPFSAIAIGLAIREVGDS